MAGYRCEKFTIARIEMGLRPKTLVISNIAWDFVWQRHQTLASLFAQDDDVVFIEVPGIRRVGWRDLGRLLARFRALREAEVRTAVPPGLKVVRPFLLPATNRCFGAINRRLIRRSIAREPQLAAGVDLILNYSPSRSARELIANVRHSRLIYDCTDDWLAVQGIPSFLPTDECALLAQADLTLVPSRALVERKRQHARRIERVPHGALVERFLSKPRIRTKNEPVTLLYYGHLHAQHFDFAAIDELARARPAWKVVLVGPTKTPHAFPANVRVVPQQPHEKLLAYVSAADALLLPYKLNDYTRAVLPAKIYECLATGRPIIAAPLPELVADFSDYLCLVEGQGLWSDAAERGIAVDTAEAQAARVELAQRNSWQSRYASIRELISRLDDNEASINSS
jgi:glycosyltransferase involved in cell wall biosynthesis